MRRSASVLLFALASCVSGSSSDDPYEYAAPAECPDTGGVPYTTARQPNVMLVVDRSGSMEQGMPSRWEQLLSLVPYLDGVEQASRVGLTLFPAPGSGDDCATDGGIVVPLTDDDDADVTIGAALEESPPSGGNTPMAGAIELVAAEGRLQDPYRDNVVVLLSDGEPTCSRGVGEVKVAVRDLVEGGDVPVELFVIGFGVTSAADAALAEIAAEASGTTSGENYFTANTVEELLDRLYRVAATLDACTFTLEDDVAPEDLVVYAAGREIDACTSEDCLDGYVYDRATSVVRLAAVTCRDLGGAECPDVRFETR